IDSLNRRAEKKHANYSTEKLCRLSTVQELSYFSLRGEFFPGQDQGILEKHCLEMPTLPQSIVYLLFGQRTSDVCPHVSSYCKRFLGVLHSQVSLYASSSVVPEEHSCYVRS
ncbi:hypothetical protein KIL84_015765, partial [Mauremys mutica]